MGLAMKPAAKDGKGWRIEVATVAICVELIRLKVNDGSWFFGSREAADESVSPTDGGVASND